MKEIKDLMRIRLQDMIDENILERGLMILEDKLDAIRILLEQRSIPENGWTTSQIEWFFSILSSMDTDKDPDAARVGEREARVASDYVLSLATGFSHGIGRSGDIAAIQPKAPGGSILNLIADRIATSLLRAIGLTTIKASIVLPVATGMSIALALSAIHQDRQVNQGASWEKNEVIYPRVDHKSPMKGINLAGYTPVVVQPILSGDAVEVPMDRIEQCITKKTAAIVSTTAFFPPRAPDYVKAIAKLCKDNDIPHVINNSYGVQSEFYLKLLRGAIDAGRVDYIIQSTDKNFLTPVGGAIICSPSEESVTKVSKVYPGRASAQPLVQFLASVLTLGLSGYRNLVSEQIQNRERLEKIARAFAAEQGQRLLDVPNPIAIAMTMEGASSEFGGILYNLRVTGPRFIEPGTFGSCIDYYPVPYLTLNAGIGARKDDLDHLEERLVKASRQLRRTP